MAAEEKQHPLPITTTKEDDAKIDLFEDDDDFEEFDIGIGDLTLSLSPSLFLIFMFALFQVSEICWYNNIWFF